ncbi:MAG: hypothetical protein R3F40_16330 [Candidatus Competibacteraceae bacterium]
MTLVLVVQVDIDGYFRPLITPCLKSCCHSVSRGRRFWPCLAASSCCIMTTLGAAR